MHPPIDERFDAKWMAEPNTGCHIWLAGLSGDGYGAFKVNGRQVGAHRYAWERENGPVPEGLHLDHVVCDSPLCVNPEHLEPKTCAANVLRGRGIFAVNGRKTHCLRGHALEGENLRMKNGGRICRTCQRAAGRVYDAGRRPRRRTKK